MIWKGDFGGWAWRFMSDAGWPGFCKILPLLTSEEARARLAVRLPFGFHREVIQCPAAAMAQMPPMTRVIV